jgi:hypothetical protein
MRDTDWKRLVTNRHENVKFRRFMRSYIAEISEAAEADDIKAFPRAVAYWGGFLRRERMGARITLAGELMAQLQIVPTLHVAKWVMRQTFGQAASNAVLDRVFAIPGRDATEKHMDAARSTLHQHQWQVARYRGLYRWYIAALRRTARQVKAQYYADRRARPITR